MKWKGSLESSTRSTLAGVALELDLGVAVIGRQRVRSPVDERERPGDVGVGRDRHPGIAPDQVEHARAPGRARSRSSREAVLEALRTAARPRPRGRRSRRSAGRASRLSRGPSGWVTTTFGTNSASVSASSRRFSSMLTIDVGRRQLADPVDLDVLGPADLRDRPHRLPGVDAEPGAPDELVGQAEIAEQLGDARDQADDARVLVRARTCRCVERIYMLRRYSPPTS